MWHGYFAIEDLDLTTIQRQTLIDRLKLLGDNDNSQPAKRNHRRTSLDKKIVIFEAEWDVNNISIQAIRNRLGVLFSVDPETIDYNTANQNTNSIITFSRSGTNKIRMALFGGLFCTWSQSRQSCENYIQSNLVNWEEGI